jgi:hypothetical protein
MTRQGLPVGSIAAILDVPELNRAIGTTTSNDPTVRTECYRGLG